MLLVPWPVPHLLCGAVDHVLPCGAARPHLRFAHFVPSNALPKGLLFGMTVTLGRTWLGLGLGLG